jgi:glycosyltransferase involved in cell wall biosynthesis
MKNLDFALQVLAQVSIPVTFDIYGNIEDRAYWRHCQRLMEVLPANVVATYMGTVNRESLAQRMTTYDLFFLPTRGENFGHVVLEALQCGLPVLISDRTPWQDLPSKGAGWSLTLANPKAFVDVIEEVARWSAERHSAASAGARQLAGDYHEKESALKQHVDMFDWLLSKRHS